jgi:hypothetical protein
MNHYQQMGQDDIESLAMTRTFAELSEKERALVTAHLGDEEAYTRMRMAIVAARRTLTTEGEALEPAPEIRSAAHAAMAGRRKRTPVLGGFLGSIAGYRVPLYQPTLAALAAIMVVFLVRPEPREQPVRERVIYRTVAAAVAPVDTEEIVRRVVDSLRGELERPARVEVRTVVVHDGRREDSSKSALAPRDSAEPRQDAPPRGNMFVGLANLKQLEIQRRGKNLAEDSAGSRFMVTSVPDKF